MCKISSKLISSYLKYWGKRILTSFKGCSSVMNWWKWLLHNPKLPVITHMQNLVKIHPSFPQDILSGKGTVTDRWMDNLKTVYPTPVLHMGYNHMIQAYESVQEGICQINGWKFHHWGCFASLPALAEQLPLKRDFPSAFRNHSRFLHRPKWLAGCAGVFEGSLTRWACALQNQQTDLCAQQTQISLGICPVKSVFTVRIKKACVLSYTVLIDHTAKTDQSSLGAQVLSCSSSLY